MLLFCAVFTGCGLETFYYLDPPVLSGTEISYTSDDRASHVFELTTNEASNSAMGDGFLFRGTEIYYKIYNNSSAMVSVNKAIDSLNSSSDISAAALRLINTYNYRTLTYAGTVAPSPLVTSSGSNTKVQIRLSDYGSDYSFRNVVRMSPSVGVVSWTDKGRPRRFIGNSYGFNFNRKDSSNNPLPVEGDSDYTCSSSFTSSGVYYVDVYAVAMGYDTSFSASYSRVVHLGAVKINSAWYD